MKTEFMTQKLVIRRKIFLCPSIAMRSSIRKLGHYVLPSLVMTLALLTTACAPDPLATPAKGSFLSMFGRGSSDSNTEINPLSDARVPPVLPAELADGSEIFGPSSIKTYIHKPQILPPTVMDDDLFLAVERLYQHNQMQPLWHDGEQWLPAALNTVETLQSARRHGLMPEDYLPAQLALPNYQRSSPAAITQAELALTSGVLRYIVDVKEGRYAPNQTLDPVATFISGVQQDDYHAWLRELSAENWVYSRMINATGQHETLSGHDWDRYRVTMERLRWDAPELPSDGRYLLVNLGAAEVWAMDGLTLDLGANAVVGRASRRTPLRDDTIINLKFSPDWTAPYSIIENDLVQMARENPSIIEQMGLEIYRDGQLVNPQSIDWRTIDVRRYVFRQPPGPNNVLGGVRFTLANNQSIYIHDSPDKGLFDAAFRARSSGCVRLGAIDKFALWLLAGEDPGWTLEQVQDRMTQPQTSFVALNRRTPVKTIYTTAWVSHNGRLVTSADVYGVNSQLRRQMGLPIELVGDSGVMGAQNISDVF